MAFNYFKTPLKLYIQSNLTRNSCKILSNCRYSSYQNSPNVADFKPSVDEYEVSSSKADWEFVERLLPPMTVPKPIVREVYATDWRPPSASPQENHKYFINRNRNFQMPVYVTTTHRGMRKLTEIHKIHGDIHEMEKDLKETIRKSIGKPVASQINELVGCITFKGDYVRIIKEYLMSKGF